MIGIKRRAYKIYLTFFSLVNDFLNKKGITLTDPN